MDKLILNFARFGGPVYTGRPNGEAARAKSGLDEFDRQVEGKAIVQIPNETFSVNSSFFLGLFGLSVRHAGSREAFLRKYEFDVPDYLKDSIEDGISLALQERNVLLK